MVNTATTISLSNFPTNVLSSNYYGLACNIVELSNNKHNANAFKISIINCAVPPINTATIKSRYSNNMKL